MKRGLVGVGGEGNTRARDGGSGVDDIGASSTPDFRDKEERNIYFYLQKFSSLMMRLNQFS